MSPAEIILLPWWRPEGHSCVCGTQPYHIWGCARRKNKPSRLSNESCRWINYIWSLNLDRTCVLWTSRRDRALSIAQYSRLVISHLLHTWGHKGEFDCPRKSVRVACFGAFYRADGPNPLTAGAGSLWDAKIADAPSRWREADCKTLGVKDVRLCQVKPLADGISGRFYHEDKRKGEKHCFVPGISEEPLYCVLTDHFIRYSVAEPK